MSGGGNFGAKRFPRTPKQVSERTSKQLRAKQYNPNTICSHVVGGTSQGRMPPSADYRVPCLGEWIEVWHVCLQEGRIVLHIYSSRTDLIYVCVIAQWHHPWDVFRVPRRA